MKHRKKLFWLCMSLIMMLMLASCGKKTSETGTVSDENDSQEEVSPEADSEKNIVETELDDAVKEEIQTLHVLVGMHSDYEWSEEYTQSLANAAYPVIQLDNCCAKEHPELSQAFGTLNETEKASVMTEYENLKEYALSEQKEYPEDFIRYETTEELSVRRADSRVVSLLYEGYYFSGGVHGMVYFHGENFDTVTGTKLELSDVVTDVSVLPELIMKQFEKYEKIEALYEDLDLNDYINSYPEGFSWVLDYNGITFFFDPYTIGPYASGTQIATISYAEHPELIKEEYQKVPESYGVELDNYNPFYYDLDSDGSLDELFVYGTQDEYATYINHSITINSMSAEFETYAYVMEPRLIHAADGKNYLYIQDTSDNDYRTIAVYALSDGYAEKVGVMDSGWYNFVVDQENYFALEQVLTDPDEFKLDNRTEVLSTMSGYKNYRIDSNGMPVTDDTYFVLNDKRYLTLLQPLEVYTIQEETGEITGEQTLQTGTEVLYYRTDNMTFADLQLSDGSVVRVWMDQMDWPRCINGVIIDEIFDGMIFAG